MCFLPTVSKGRPRRNYLESEREAERKSGGGSQCREFHGDFAPRAVCAAVVVDDTVAAPLSLPAYESSNSVGMVYDSDGNPRGGRGGAVYNGAPSSTILFNRLAVFQDNAGALVRIPSNGSTAVLLVDARPIVARVC